MHRGRLPAYRCRHQRVDGLQRPLGCTASGGNTPSPNSVCRFVGRRRFDVEDDCTNVLWLAIPWLGATNKPAASS
jgi:hypothetical protein